MRDLHRLGLWIQQAKEAEDVKVFSQLPTKLLALRPADVEQDVSLGVGN